MKRIPFTATTIFTFLSLLFALAAGTTTMEAALKTGIGLDFFIPSQSLFRPPTFGEQIKFEARGARPVLVLNIEQLYAAVNNPANAGATIVLAPGVYMLSVNDERGMPRPNRGRLELQENMSLQGSVDNRGAVVIDASDLPVSSYQTPQLTGAIRIGRGSNTIEWLTVRRAVNGSANIETDLIWPGTAYIRIAHTASTGSVRGLDIRNLGAAAAGAVIVAEIVDNDLFSNRLRLAEGMRIGNNLGAHGSSIFATLSGNRSFDNFQGLLIENNRSNFAHISVVSSGDRFFENGAGTIIIGGLSFSSTPTNGNTVNFTAHSSSFDNNNGFTTFDRGGLIVVGGENLSIQNGTSDNSVNVELRGCLLVNNQLMDLGAFGARSNPVSVGLPGTNNRVTIAGFGSRRGSNVVWADSVPDYQGGGNSVTFFQ